MYDFDKENKKYRSYLGLYLASYYSKQINKREYKYKEKENIFTHKNKLLKVLYAYHLEDASDSYLDELIAAFIKSLARKELNNITLIIFVYGEIDRDLKKYQVLKDKYQFEELVIINSQYFIALSEKNKMTSRTSKVSSLLSIKAKEILGGDFAVN